MQLPLRNSPAQQGFVIFTCLGVNRHIPPFTGEGFLTLSPSPGFICCVSNCKGNASLSPPQLASNGSIPLRSTTIFFAWLSILRILHRYSRLSMQCLDMTLQRAAVNQSIRVHDTEWSSLVARRTHNPKVVGSNPSSVPISDLPRLEQIVALGTRQVRA